LGFFLWEVLFVPVYVGGRITIFLENLLLIKKIGKEKRKKKKRSAFAFGYKSISPGSYMDSD
jgi:hypothetical protein